MKFSNSKLIKNVNRIKKGIFRHWQLYLLVIPPLAYLIIFKYVPLIGSVIAFKDYSFAKGVFGSDWVGAKHFIRFFKSPQFKMLMFNTIGLSLYQIIAGIMPPILLAIALNYARNRIFKKTVQMVTYMPYFISTVLVVGILSQILSLNGIVNQVIRAMGAEPVHFMGDPKLFRSLYVFSGIWQNTGYNAVIYLAALAAISPELYEAAIIDGASVWKRIFYIDIPSIFPTTVILLILACGRILSIGYEKVLLMQNNMNMQTSDIISTYVYRVGLISMQYSYSTAIGLFQSVVSFVLLVLVNRISRSLNETSLW